MYIDGLRTHGHSDKVCRHDGRMSKTIFGFCRRVVGIATLLVAFGSVAPAELPGDVNCDGSVGPEDVDVLLACLFGAADAGECPCADVNGDGVVTPADLTELVRLTQTPPTPTPSSTPTLTPTPRSGPRIVFIGLAGPDGTVLSPVAVDDGIAVFQRSSGSGFQLVVEAVPGANGVAVGSTVFNSVANDPQARPDVQAEASRPLGDGDPGVCTEGGIAGFNPFDFGSSQRVADGLNDFGCAFTVAAAGRRARHSS